MPRLSQHLRQRKAEAVHQVDAEKPRSAAAPVLRHQLDARAAVGGEALGALGDEARRVLPGRGDEDGAGDEEHGGVHPDHRELFPAGVGAGRLDEERAQKDRQHLHVREGPAVRDEV